MVFAPLTSWTLHEKAGIVRVAGNPLQVAMEMPESASITVPETAMGDVATVVFGSGEPITIEGPVLSIFKVIEAGAVFLALSVAFRDMI